MKIFNKLVILFFLILSFSFALDAKERLFTQPKSRNMFFQKPRLAIIVDDVSTEYEADLIKSIPYKVTPSLFPPTAAFPNTPYIAKNFDFYMVHLPLEAKNFYKPQPDTLYIKDSETVIKKKLIKIKKLFPRVVYINNHTGSAYTSNYNAMFKLYKIFNQLNLIFVDSKTIGSTKARDIAEIFDNEFLQRDVFIDNYTSEEYIIEQLRKAIIVAKKEGYAIAIGHPKIETLNVLRRIKYIFKDVDIVYVKDLI